MTTTTGVVLRGAAALAATVAGVWGGGVAHAQGTTYTDPGAFMDAVASAGFGGGEHYDFDDLPAGTVIPFGSPIPPGTTKPWQPYQWQYDSGLFLPVNGLITDAFDAASGENAFGLDTPPGRFLPGDYLDVDSGAGLPQYAVGLMLIASPLVPAGAVTLEAGPLSVANADAPLTVLPDGGEVYFLGILSDTPFTRFTIASDPFSGVFAYTIDDVWQVVPAPNAGAALAVGLLLCGGRRRCAPRASLT